MNKVKCPKCGTISKAGSRFCPNCGETLENAEVLKTPTIKNKKAAAATAAAILCLAALIVIIPNLNPKGKYQSLIEQGKTKEAEMLYQEKISSNEKLSKELNEEEVQKIQKIYEDYKKVAISYDDAVDELEKYTEPEITRKKANDIKKSLQQLKESREAYAEAKKNEDNEDLEKALLCYRKVIEEDENYAEAEKRAEEINGMLMEKYIAEAADYAADQKYSDALSSIRNAISKCGEDDQLDDLIDQYEKMKEEQYIKVEVTDKSVTPRDSDKWIFSDYVNFVFEITNNSGKDIKGIEGALTVKDLFGKEILTMGCDFTGHTIKKGEKYINSDLSFECNEFIDSHMQLFNTDYDDLQFHYEPTSIVFADGTTIVPE